MQCTNVLVQKDFGGVELPEPKHFKESVGKRSVDPTRLRSLRIKQTRKLKRY